MKLSWAMFLAWNTTRHCSSSEMPSAELFQLYISSKCACDCMCVFHWNKLNLTENPLSALAFRTTTTSTSIISDAGDTLCPSIPYWQQCCTGNHRSFARNLATASWMSCFHIFPRIRVNRWYSIFFYGTFWDC